MDNKEKVLIGAVSFLAGAAVGFLLAPVKKIVSFEKFSCNNIEDSEVDSSLETSEDRKVDNKEKVLIGAVSFLAGAAVGFLLAPVKKIVSFEKFSCNNIEDSEVDSSLETSEDDKVDKDEEKEEIKE